MGHAASLPSGPPTASFPSIPPSASASHLRRYRAQLTAESPPPPPATSPDPPLDVTLSLPDDCLALIFQSLTPADRNSCSLVCCRWLTVDAQSRHRLVLNATGSSLDSSPTLFFRFDALTNLTLKCPRDSDGITDEALIFIATRCPNLTHLKLLFCRNLTEFGMYSLAAHCPKLRKLTCLSCTFGSTGINAVLRNCPLLEDLSLKRLRGLRKLPTDILVGGPSLRSIYLKDLKNSQCFVPLIASSPNLQNIKLSGCSGKLDHLLEEIAVRIPGISTLNLEKLQIRDHDLFAFSSCINLDNLHLVKIPECTNAGLAAITKNCHMLCKIEINCWKVQGGIGDEGLMAVARHCPNLQELVLIGVNPLWLSLSHIATNCRKLERLVFSSSGAFGDREMSRIATKCIALKKLSVKGCPISNRGLETLVDGFPNLMKVSLKKCKWLTLEGVDWLRLNRPALAINFEIMAPSL